MSKKQKGVHDAPAAAISDNGIAGISGVQMDEDSKALLIPAVDEEELAEDLATRGKKMIAVKPPKGVGLLQFRNMVANYYMLYMFNRRLPTEAEVQEYTGYPYELIQNTLHSPEFIRAMLIRGIDCTGTSVLTAEQDMAIAIMATPNGKPFEQKLKVAGVAPSKWRAWLKQAKFRAVWDSVAGTVLTDHENDMMVALVGQALNGDVQAVKYAFQVSGRYDPVRNQQVDAQILLNSFIEILQQELAHDPETLQKIGARMQLVAAGKPAPRILEIEE